MRLDGNLDTCTPGHVSGWARDADRPGLPLALEVWSGRTRLGDCVADTARADLTRHGIGPHGFAFTPAQLLAAAELDGLHLRAEGCGEALFDAYGGAQPNPFLLPPPPRPASARFRRCVLHLGTEKTGTTSLQRFLALNRERLLAQGVLVPVSLVPPDEAGGLNHSDLVALALADWRLDDSLRRARGIADAAALARFRAGSTAALAAEFATAPAGCTTLLLSSEHCHSRMLLLHEFAALQGFLAPWVERFELIVYLRPQHELALSQAAMRLLDGEAEVPLLPGVAAEENPAYFDYARLLARWAAIFGRGALRPVPYTPADLAGGDVIDDFAARAGLDIAGFARPGRLAGNLAPRAHKFLRAFLAATAERGGVEAAWSRDFVTANLRASEPGRGMSPARAAAEAFAARFDAGNARVCAEWFPGRPRLFDLDFTSFPEQEDRAPLTAAEVMDILVGLLRAESLRPRPG
jgi:hypothetical protein